MRELLFPLAMTVFESDQAIIDDIRALPESAFHQMMGDSERTHAASSALFIARSGEVAEAKRILDTFNWSAEPSAILNLCRKLLEGEMLPLRQRLLILTDLIKSTSKGGDGNWRMFVEALHRALDARKSGLLQRAIWVEKLKLPEDSFPILLPSADTVSIDQ